MRPFPPSLPCSAPPWSLLASFLRRFFGRTCGDHTRNKGTFKALRFAAVAPHPGPALLDTAPPPRPATLYHAALGDAVQRKCHGIPFPRLHSHPVLYHATPRHGRPQGSVFYSAPYEAGRRCPPRSAAYYLLAGWLKQGLDCPRSEVLGGALKVTAQQT